MSHNEVIAVLVAGYDDDGVERATVILRDVRGNVSLKQMDPHELPAGKRIEDARFRQGRPIRDPLSREIVGYELERVARPH